MKSTCISTPANSRLILVEDWMIVACDGNHCAAMLMSFMIYWHDVRLNQVEKSRQQNQIAESHGETATQDTSLLQFHNERELELGLLGIYKARTITDALHVLTEKGFVERHSNPNPRYHFDRTRYFLLKPQNIQRWIDTSFATMSRSEVDYLLAPERERQKRRTDAAILPNVGNIGLTHRQNCSTVAQKSDVVLQNCSVLHEITTCDYSQDSLGDVDTPQTPSQSFVGESAHSLLGLIGYEKIVLAPDQPQWEQDKNIVTPYDPTLPKPGTVRDGVSDAPTPLNPLAPSAQAAVIAPAQNAQLRVLSPASDLTGITASIEAVDPPSTPVSAKSNKGSRKAKTAKTDSPEEIKRKADHVTLMETLRTRTGQPILNGGAQAAAVKRILGAYTVEQAIEVLEHQLAGNWRGPVSWLSVQTQIADYFRRKEQTKLGGNNGKSKFDFFDICNSQPFASY